MFAFDKKRNFKWSIFYQEISKKKATIHEYRAKFFEIFRYFHLTSWNGTWNKSFGLTFILSYLLKTNLLVILNIFGAIYRHLTGKSNKSPSVSRQVVSQEYVSLKLSDFTVVATLGVGGFGRVELVRHMFNEQSKSRILCKTQRLLASHY